VRQQAYLNALATLPRVEVHLGTFMSSVVSQVVVETDPNTGRYMKAGGRAVLKTDPVTGALEKAWVHKTEEKGSDVNLAAYLLRDAYRSACQCAVIISNDSDLLTPIHMAKADCGLTIGLAPPRPKGHRTQAACRLQGRTANTLAGLIAILGSSRNGQRFGSPPAAW
jgi:hypothetical protein